MCAATSGEIVRPSRVVSVSTIAFEIVPFASDNKVLHPLIRSVPAMHSATRNKAALLRLIIATVSSVSLLLTRRERICAPSR